VVRQLAEPLEPGPADGEAPRPAGRRALVTWIVRTRQLVMAMLSVAMTLLIICVATFGLMQLVPGGPLAALGGSHGKASRQEIQILTQEFLLNKPAYIQFWAWLRSCLEGHFGYSLVSGSPVTQIIEARVLPSAELFVAIAAVSVAASWVLGLWLAKHEGGWADRIVLSLTGVAQGIPAFWIGVLAIYVLVKAGGSSGPILPIAGSESYQSSGIALGDLLLHLILPTFVGALVVTSYYIRVVRDLAVDALQDDYVHVARAKGLSEMRVVNMHVGKNIVGPLLGLMGADLPSILTGLVAIEEVFSWPGLGQLLASSSARQDYPVVLAITVISGAIAIVSMRLSRLLADWIGTGRREALNARIGGRQA
jgi:peptide/nickel transport system permease protein